MFDYFISSIRIFLNHLEAYLLGNFYTYVKM